MLLDEIGAYLAAQGLGDLDHDIFLGAHPDTPDACTILLERPSAAPIGTHDNLIAQEQPRLQVVCRGAANDYLGPRQQAEKVYQQLAQIINQTLSGTRYLLVIPSPPFPIGRDESARWLIGCNAEVLKNPS
jgi:hypothetical protein